MSSITNDAGSDTQYHLLVSDVDKKKLWYMKADLNQLEALPVKAILLHEQVYIYESIFVGSATSTINGMT